MFLGNIPVSYRRLGLILGLSLAVHLLLLTRGAWQVQAPEPTEERLNATLVAAPPAPVVPPALPPVPPPTRPATAPPPARHAAHAASPPPAPVAPALVPTDAAPPASATPPDASPAFGSASANTAPALPNAALLTPGPTPPPVLTPAPPAIAPTSATLEYRVLAVDPRADPPKTLQASGTVHWKTDGTHYALDLEAEVNLVFMSVSLLKSHSEGSVGPSGLVPTSYSESPRNKASATTRFNPPTDSGLGTITFSNDPKIVPLAPGTQDKLSILLQLGALLRANPDLGRAGAMFTVQVAGVRGDADLWTFNSLGTEPVRTSQGTVNAIHVARQLRPNTHDRGIDVWLAMDRGGYPVQFRYTEPNTSHIDLTLESIH